MVALVRSIDEWQKFLNDRNKGSLQQLCTDILSEIDGYGVEYGFDTDEDGEDLANAFQALNLILHPADVTDGASKVSEPVIQTDYDVNLWVNHFKDK